MTKFDIINNNKRLYKEQEQIISTMGKGFERLVAESLVLAWIKGTGWLGGMPDSKFASIYEKKFAPLGYDAEFVLDEFHRQIDLVEI